MPRYIDADEIPYTMLYKEDWIKGTGVEKQGVWKSNIDKMPTADVVERKVGKWVDDKGLYRCSACNHLWSELWWVENCPMERMYKIMRFCPNCGAEMEQ